MSWANNGVGLDLNVPPEEESEPPVRFAWITHATDAARADEPPEPAPTAVAHDTASFLEELIPLERPGDDTRGKRKRADSHERGNGGADDATADDGVVPQPRAERTIERYYDHAIPPDEAGCGDKRTKRERKDEGDEEEQGEPEAYNGFEVMGFQVVCPIASFKVRRKKGAALKAAIEEKQIRCRIPPFEDTGAGAGVFMADGLPKPIRSPHEIVASSCTVNLEAGEATVTFSEGFRFKSNIEFDIFFFIDAFEEMLCAGVFSASTMQEKLTMCNANYFRSNSKYDGFYTDLHRYELQYEDSPRHSKAILKGRVLCLAKDEFVWVSLMKCALPIDETSLPADKTDELARRAEEEEEEEDDDDDEDGDDEDNEDD